MQRDEMGGEASACSSQFYALLLKISNDSVKRTSCHWQGLWLWRSSLEEQGLSIQTIYWHFPHQKPCRNSKGSAETKWTLVSKCYKMLEMRSLLLSGEVMLLKIWTEEPKISEWVWFAAGLDSLETHPARGERCWTGLVCAWLCPGDG